MNEFQATAVLVAMFALRCVVPLVLLVAIGYAMNRLANRWEAEEQAARDARPSIPVAMAAAPPARAQRVPCWVFRNCDEATRARCPAYQTPSLACWVALARAEGKVPARCAGCSHYTGMPALAAGH